MNDTRDESWDFSLSRQYRTARGPDADQGGEDSAAKSAPSDKPAAATVLDNALPDRIRRKYYVVANESGKEGSDGNARLYADERGEYLAFKGHRGPFGHAPRRGRGDPRHGQRRAT